MGKICDYIKKNGWNAEVPEIRKWSSVDIEFEADGMEDETQFDIEDAGTEKGALELENLFIDFCKENRYVSVKLCHVAITKTGDERESLFRDKKTEQLVQAVAELLSSARESVLEAESTDDVWHAYDALRTDMSKITGKSMMMELLGK